MKPTDKGKYTTTNNTGFKISQRPANYRFPPPPVLFSNKKKPSNLISDMPILGISAPRENPEEINELLEKIAKLKSENDDLRKVFFFV